VSYSVPRPALLTWPVPQARVRTWLLVAVGALAVVHVCVLAYHLAAIVRFPFDLDYGEGYVLNDAVRLSRGEPIYVDLQQFPMVRSPYPPLFLLIWSGLVGVTGPVLWPGRAISIVATVGLALLLARNATKVRAGVWPIVVAPAVFLASPFVYQWAGYARVDMLALLLAAAGVYAAQWLGGWRGVLVAALLCGLALWTKQTTLTATVAVAIAFGLRSWRKGLAFVGLVGVPSALAVLALEATTGGEFGRHVLFGNASNPVYALRGVFFVGTFVALYVTLLTADVWWLSKALRGAPSPIAVYLPVALLAAFSAGNSGSSVNYLIEPIVALCLALPFAWRAGESLSPLIGPFMAVVQLALLVHWPNSIGTGYLALWTIGRTPEAADVAVGEHLDALVRATSGGVLAEPAGFDVRNGRPVAIQPLDLRGEELRGRWRSDALVQALSTGRFELVITDYEFLPNDAARVLRESFTLDEVVPSPVGLTFKVYRFKR